MKILQAIGRFIEGQLTLKAFLPLLAVALGTTWYGLFSSTARFASMTRSELFPDGLRFMDMQPGLTADQLFAQIRSYSDSTVDYYILWSLFDYAWPFVTFTTMLFISRWLLGFIPDKWLRWFPLFVASAYLTVLMDWGENTGFIALVTGLPAEPGWLAQLTLGLHAGKLFCNMVFNLAFWALLVAVVISRLSRLRTGSAATH